MCLTFISFYQSEQCPLIILNNRDEVCERPTIPLEEFKLNRDEIEPLRDSTYGYNSSANDNNEYYSKDDDIRMYCGKDRVGGGTWLGVNNKGKWCIILNLYNKDFHASSSSSGKLSRGKIVQNYLSSKISPFNYISLMENTRHLYHPFVLVVGDIINSSEKYYCLLSHLLPPKELYNDQLPVNLYPSFLKVLERNTVFGISNYPLHWNTNKVEVGKGLLDHTLKSILKERKLVQENQNGNQAHSSNDQDQQDSTTLQHDDKQDLFTNLEESKLLNILYNDDKCSIAPAPTEHINTSSIYVHPYHSKQSTKVHSTVSSSLITFTKSSPTSNTLMTFNQVDNLNNKSFKIKSYINSNNNNNIQSNK